MYIRLFITLGILVSFFDNAFSQNSFSAIDTLVCSAELPIEWNGNTFETFGTFTFSTSNSSGSDSVITINIIEKSSDCAICHDTVPYRLADLHNAPDSLWVLVDNNLTRQGACCMFLNQDTSLGCISFNVYLDQGAVGFIFDVDNPAPSGDEYYRVDCGPLIPLGEFACLQGGKFYTVTFCKPGEDNPRYMIQSVSGAVTPDSLSINLDEKNSLNLQVNGLEPSTIEWSVNYPAGADSLIKYLNATNIENPTFTPDSQSPSLIVFGVCGTLPGISCNSDPVKDCASIIINISSSEYKGAVTSTNIIGDFSSNLKHDYKPDIYPNPSNGSFIVELERLSSQRITIEVYNTIGERITCKEIICSDRLLRTEIDLEGNDKGIYFIRILDGKRTYSNAIVIY